MLRTHFWACFKMRPVHRSKDLDVRLHLQNGHGLFPEFATELVCNGSTH